MKTCTILLMFGTFSIFIYLVKNDDLKKEEKEYLRKFGYLNLKADNPFLASISKDLVTSAIKNFQRMAGLDQTGVMDSMTRKMMKMPRCGVSDILIANEHRRKRYVLSGYTWDNKALTYQIVNHVERLPRHKIDQTIIKSTEYWQNVSSLTFRRTENPIIKFIFYSRDHGCGFSFDGRGGDLAHAFSPGRFQDSGHVHFDADELWTIDDDTGTDLLYISVHELGHALGLSHSDVNGSIMSPFYYGYDPNLKLHDDDIRAIQILYGPPSNDTITISHTTTTPIKVQGQICQVKKPNAVFSLVDLLFVMEGNRLFVMQGLFDNKAMEYKASSVFPQIPKNVDAAFAFDTMSGRNIIYIYFFSGSQVWKYIFKDQPIDFNLLKEYPKLISTEFPGVPSDLNAAFAWNLNGKTYFFKDEEYYGFSESMVPPTYSRPIKNWNLGIAAVDTAFSYPSKSFSDLYFVNDSQIYKYDRNRDGLDFGYPRSWQWFFGCIDPLKNNPGKLHKPSVNPVSNFTMLISTYFSFYYMLFLEFAVQFFITK